MDLQNFLKENPLWLLVKAAASVAVSCWLFANYIYLWLLPGHDQNGYQTRGTIILTAAGIIFSAFCIRQIVKYVLVVQTRPLHAFLDARNELVITTSYLEMDISRFYHGYASWDDYLRFHPLLTLRKGWFGLKIEAGGSSSFWNVRYLGYSILHGEHRIQLIDVNRDSLILTERSIGHTLAEALSTLLTCTSVHALRNAVWSTRQKSIAIRLASSKKPKKVDRDVN